MDCLRLMIIVNIAGFLERADGTIYWEVSPTNLSSIFHQFINLPMISICGLPEFPNDRCRAVWSVRCSVVLSEKLLEICDSAIVSGLKIPDSRVLSRQVRQLVPHIRSITQQLCTINLILYIKLICVRQNNSKRSEKSNWLA